MELTAVDVSVQGPHGSVLDPTNVVAGSGAVTVVTGYPGPGQVALALALAGRLPLSSGRVLVDGVPDLREEPAAGGGARGRARRHRTRTRAADRIGGR